ncbi:putative reverse transcriptase domain-containing protein [Tanacetum coccineum]
MVTTRRNSDDDVPNFEAMIVAAVANALPNLTAALRTQITNDIRNGILFDQKYYYLKPLAFRSAATPAEAEDWITHIEKLFQVLGCPDNFKTRLAGFKLEGDALSWWKAHLRTQVGGDAFVDNVHWLLFLVRSFTTRVTEMASFVGLTAEMAQGKLDISSGGLKKWFWTRDQRSTDTVSSKDITPLLHLNSYTVKDCPQAKQKQNMPTDFARLPPTTGRVYATTRDQAAKTSATHSIISTTFAKKLNMNPTPLIERVIISTPMKNHMLIDHEYVNCPLRFDDRIRPANLLPIHMLDFDVISCMEKNWLASHRATIDCYARTVIFGNVRQPEFVYHGSSPLKSVKLISAMKARTLISHGCQGFLASVMDTSLEGPNIENLSVVREFADVFPDELPGLPPAREIEFGIELIPGAEPISKAPYKKNP